MAMSLAVAFGAALQRSHRCIGPEVGDPHGVEVMAQRTFWPTARCTAASCCSGLRPASAPR